MNTATQSPANGLVSAIAPGMCLALVTTFCAGPLQAAPQKPAAAPTAEAGAPGATLAAKQLELEAVRKELADLRASIDAKPNTDDLAEGLKKEADKLREALAAELKGYKVEAVDPGKVGPAQPEVAFAAPVTVRVTPEGGNASVTVDVPATADPSGKWTMPSTNAVREALKQRAGADPGAANTGTTGRAGFDSKTVDISSPAPLESVSKRARTGGDISGATPAPDSLTLPMDARSTPTISLDGGPLSLEADDELTPVANSGKPFVPPSGSLDAPLSLGEPAEKAPAPAPQAGGAPKSLDGPGE